MSDFIEHLELADDLIISAYKDWLLVIHGWTVPISKADALRYIHEYNSPQSVNGGFRENDLGQTKTVILTHNGAKMTMTPQQSIAMRGFIGKVYREHYTDKIAL